MQYTPLSPFKRPISHAHLRVIETPQPPQTARPVNKWELFRELVKAQATFGVTDRDLTVLQGLLSFFPETALDGNFDLVVFPSNKSICERLNGMPCSTMRRHLARLVDAGLLARHDSPNGKRYVRKLGGDRVSFGFDLAPLYRQADAICHAAEIARSAEDRIRRLREVVSLMRRDLAALADFGATIQPGLGFWDQIHDMAALAARALRRKLSLAELTQFQQDIAAMLDLARNLIDGPDTEELVTSDAHSEQHHLNSKKDDIDSEPGFDKVTSTTEQAKNADAIASDAQDPRPLPKIPLHMVTSSCPSIATFYQGPVRHWHQLHAAACHIRPAMGISGFAWDEAQRCMGPEQASIVLVAMLERFAEIRNPGGYLRALTTKASAGAFSCGPMVMSLFGRRHAA